MSNGKSPSGVAMAVAFLGAIIGVGIAVLVITTGTFTPPVKPEPTATTQEPAPQPAEIFVDEDSSFVPDVTPPEKLSVIMRPEDRDGKDPLTRCHEMGGNLTLDNICHDVDY